MLTKPFEVDWDNSDEDRLYIDIPGRASVCIVLTDEGVIVDLFDANIQLEAVATMGATWEEINAPA